MLGSRAVPIVRIRNRGMFASGSATVAPGYYRLLERIGEALKAEKGPVHGRRLHRQPADPHRAVPVQFPALAARAEAARAIIVRALGDPGAGHRAGQADADPMASNATPEGREQNRRIEVVLRRQG